MRLDIYKNGIQVQSILLDAGTEYCIGRASDNDIVLDSQSVSRHHAKIVLDGSGTITVTDLESTNGTFLADKKISACKWRHPADIVSIGDVQLRLSLLNAQEKNEVAPEIAAGEIPPILTIEAKAGQKKPAAFPLPASEEGEKKRSPKKSARKKYSFSGSLLLTALIVPFAAFLVIDQMGMNSTFLRLVKVESVKAELVWNIHKQQQIRRQLAKAREYLASNKLKLSKTIIAEVLTKDPLNKEAVTLQNRLTEVYQAQKIKKEQAGSPGNTTRKTPLISKSNEQVIKGYLKTIQDDIAQKKYADCLTHAQKIIRISPGNQRAVQLINFCNNALLEIVAARQAEKKKKAQEEQTKAKLQKILGQGKKAFGKKKYNTSLKLLQKGLQLDPENKYKVTNEIRQQIKKVRKSMGKLADSHVRRAKKEKSRGHALKALHYYELAHNILPGNEKIKSLYQAQLIANQNTALNLYNEAIAYASLGSFDDAKTALRQAKKLAKGNRELYQRIKKQLDSLAKK